VTFLALCLALRALALRALQEVPQGQGLLALCVSYSPPPPHLASQGHLVPTCTAATAEEDPQEGVGLMTVSCSIYSRPQLRPGMKRSRQDARALGTTHVHLTAHTMHMAHTTRVWLLG